MILEITYRVLPAREKVTEPFDFDTDEYRNDRDNWTNVVSDYLDEKHGVENYDRLHIQKQCS